MPKSTIPISVAIITKNEELHIQECLKSCADFREVVVVDDYSSDETVNIAKECGAKVYTYPFESFSKQKQYAVNLCNNEWVIVLDADERITPNLSKEIADLELTPTTAYKIKRANFFKGKPVRYSGWQNDCITRLFNKTIAGLDGRMVHEKITGASTEIVLKQSLQHHPYNDDFQVQTKTELYSNLAAEHAMIQGRKRCPLIKPTIRGAWSFLRTYIFKLGLLDGKAGFEIAIMGFRYTKLKYQIYFQKMSANQSVK